MDSLGGLIHTENVPLAKVMLTPWPGQGSQRGTPSQQEGMLLVLWLSVTLLFAKKKALQVPTTFLKNSAWRNAPQSHLPLVLLAFLKQRE